MKPRNKVQIIDITKKPEYEKYLYRCLAPMPFRKYRKRHGYLSQNIPKGFKKLLLIFNGNAVGTIEYAPANASGFPIRGDKIIVMHCIWVLRRAKGHNLGKQLINAMLENEKDAKGFATVALGNHWSPWMKKARMERLGFKSIDAFNLKHRTKHPDICFTVYLMWMPTTKNSKPPKLNKRKMLEGVHFCTAHPLYHPANLKSREIYEKCRVLLSAA